MMINMKVVLVCFTLRMLRYFTEQHLNRLLRKTKGSNNQKGVCQFFYVLLGRKFYKNVFGIEKQFRSGVFIQWNRRLVGNCFC